MAINTEIADGLTELEADFPETFVWDSSLPVRHGRDQFHLAPIETLRLRVRLNPISIRPEAMAGFPNPLSIRLDGHHPRPLRGHVGADS